MKGRECKMKKDGNFFKITFTISASEMKDIVREKLINETSLSSSRIQVYPDSVSLQPLEITLTATEEEAKKLLFLE